MDEQGTLRRASFSTLLFGSQALSLDEPQLSLMRQTLKSSATTSWILNVIKSLPDDLETLRPISNEFHDQAEELLRSFAVWASSSDDAQIFCSPSFTQYNTLLTALTVIHHLLQYLAYLELKYPNLDADARFSNAQDSVEALGLCTGLLSAYAVSNAHDRKSFEEYGAIAVRMGMMCGLVVDAQNHSSQGKKATGLAVSWSQAETSADLDRSLARFPEAYRSVLFDENRVTLTVPSSLEQEIKTDLQAAGMTVMELGLDGRFHWPGHSGAAGKIIRIVDGQLGDAVAHKPRSKSLILPSHVGSQRASTEAPHREVVWSILLEAPDWYSSVRRVLNKTRTVEDWAVVTFGSEKFIPPSLIRSFKPRLVSMTDMEQQLSQQHKQQSSENSRAYSDTDIAIVGMACKVPGADNLDEFWQILCEGKSQHRQAPPDRFSFNTPHRQDSTGRTWYGNFINDHDTFDHKFFKKTPREVASMDPQQRQLLQVAYQAVEQSGYFRKPSPDTSVGCYIGVGAVDYEDNVASHAPNAYSSTGTLRGFIAGKVSHFFGWTGPGLTVDTACSSSAVAVHLACQAILSGECNSAIAGGSNILTSPNCYQNLAAASFLSKTGQCKPFDAAADGYCRGEGCAAVFLKKLSAAVADGDQVLGVITGTAVQQNENCTPIVVPNSPSLRDLFGKVLTKSSLRPEQVTVVEAHGTGTAVGDPAEYDSVRGVLGGQATKRTTQLMLGSVKGLIGHLECVSGVISLVKCVLMIRHGMVPPQASFKTMNPAINASVSDQIIIPTALTPWKAAFKAALINNYGASGSNASMIVVQPPLQSQVRTKVLGTGETKMPFWMCAMDDASMASYAKVLRHAIQKSPSISMADVSFNIARQSNRSLPKAYIFTSRSLADLDSQLMALEKGRPLQRSFSRPERSPPVILCFGGQVSQSIGLDGRLFESVVGFRKYFEQCDSICQSLGAGSIFPHTFQREPIENIVTLQGCLFAVQYASAKCWIDNGVRPAAVVGHSFGELTALAISGVLSLPDALKMVVARARLIRGQWGSERGGMLAIESSPEDARRVVQMANAARDANTEPVVIACYNGPRSFTLAGPVAAVDLAAKLVSDHQLPVKMKRLNVTHAFHSTLTEPLMASMEDAAGSVTLRKPTIEWARCTEAASSPDISTSFFGQHLRQPVFFDHCVRRLAARYRGCVWLEAGSNSTVTNMISRALGAPSNNTFVPVNLSSDTSCHQLADTTASLWAAGLDVTFWPHADIQSSQYSLHLLPPYQFAKSKHWLELKQGASVVASGGAQQNLEDTVPETWLTFVGYQDGAAQRHARFRINTSNPRFQKLLAGHRTVQTAPICPASVQIDLALDAMSQIVSLGDSDFNPELSSISNMAPICNNPDVEFWLDLQASNNRPGEWQFLVFSSSTTGRKTPPTSHTSGVITPSAKDLSTEADLARYQRLVSHERCLEVLQCCDPDDVMQGRILYKAFADVIDYDEQYRGVAKLVGKGNASAGRVVARSDNTASTSATTTDSWFDAHVADSFCQVGGIFLNCMTEHAAGDMFVCRGIERWMRTAGLQNKGSRPKSYYDVLALHNGSVASGGFVTDVFVFHPDTGALLEVIVGLKFVQVQKQAIAKTLARLTGGGSTIVHTSSTKSGLQRDEAAMMVIPKSAPPARMAPTTPPPKRASREPAKKTEVHKPNLDNELLAKLKEVVSDLSGVATEDITLESNLADLGVDSLSGMELVRDLENRFQCSLSLDEALNVTTMAELLAFVRAHSAGSSSGGPDITAHDGTEDGNESDHGSSSSAFTSESPTASSRSSFMAATPAASDTRRGKVDVVGVLAGVIGIGREEMSASSLLSDIGVDSLMSMEVRAAIEAECGGDTELDEDLVIDGMTVAELEALVNRSPAGVAHDEHVVDFGRGNLGRASNSSSQREKLQLSLPTILEAFNNVKARTDEFILEEEGADYVAEMLPKQNELCVAYTLEAFEQLGCSIRQAQPGTRLRLPDYHPELELLVQHLCRTIEKQYGLFSFEEANKAVVRSDRPCIIRPSRIIMAELESLAPQESKATQLIQHVGDSLTRLLTGKTDGIKLIFGSERGRNLVADFYADWPLHRTCYRQLQAFLDTLAANLPANSHGSPLKILEMGAGTGGTTKWLLPLLAKLGRPIEYTFTDVSSSLVLQARKRFQATYPFMKFTTHDIEKQPVEELVETQHLVIASNAVHATHNLVQSTGNIRKILQPDGVLLMVELTSCPLWLDLVFGVFKGWWLFEDGRTHAIADEKRWRQNLRDAGFGFTDLTTGERPESQIERLVMAVACEKQEQQLVHHHQAVSSSSKPTRPVDGARQAAVDKYVNRMSSDLRSPLPACYDSGSPSAESTTITKRRVNVLVTGGTGSLGSHLVADLARRPEVDSVIVLNRPSNKTSPQERQMEALTSRGISLDEAAMKKVRVYAADTSKPKFGLSDEVYHSAIASSITHIIHSAWAMSINRPIHGFEPQFDIMHNLIRLARDAAAAAGIDNTPGQHDKIHFQFVSSIAVVGNYPLNRGGNPHVPEARVHLSDVLPIGYGDAKYACERALDETLHLFPERFATSCVRIGQIAGSSASRSSRSSSSSSTAYWNTQEHLPFLLKSSQTLKMLPRLRGLLSWTPVDRVAGALADIALLAERPYPVYHVDNPVRQEWSDMVPVLADAMRVGDDPIRIVPFQDWLDAVRTTSPSGVGSGNPASVLVEFLRDNFERMSCGGLLLGTSHSVEHSPTLAGTGPVSDELARRYVEYWKRTGFLER